MLSQQQIAEAATIIIVEPFNDMFRARMLKNRLGTLHKGDGDTVSEALANLVEEIVADEEIDAT